MNTSTFPASYDDSLEVVLHGAKNPHIIKICRRLGILDRIACFSDNNNSIQEAFGYPTFLPNVLSDYFDLRSLRFCNLVTGTCHSRHDAYQQLKALGIKACSIVDPSVDLFMCSLGESVYIQENVVLQAEVSLADNVSIASCTQVGHETTIGMSSFISGCSVVCGEVNIGSMTFIGAGCTIHPRRTIGNNCIVAAGSVVTRNIPDNELWCGNPASKIMSIKR